MSENITVANRTCTATASFDVVRTKFVLNSFDRYLFIFGLKYLKQLNIKQILLKVVSR